MQTFTLFLDNDVRYQSDCSYGVSVVNSIEQNISVLSFAGSALEMVTNKVVYLQHKNLETAVQEHRNVHLSKSATHLPQNIDGELIDSKLSEDIYWGHKPVWVNADNTLQTWLG